MTNAAHVLEGGAVKEPERLSDYPYTDEHGMREHRKQLQVDAHRTVVMAVKEGKLPPANVHQCVDCARRAEAYDHRSYYLPLAIEPVCTSCNFKRGAALPWVPAMPRGSRSRNPGAVAYDQLVVTGFDKRMLATINKAVSAKQATHGGIYARTEFIRRAAFLVARDGFPDEIRARYELRERELLATLQRARDAISELVAARDAIDALLAPPKSTKESA